MSNDDGDFVIIKVIKDRGKSDNKFFRRYQAKLLYATDGLIEHFKPYMNETFNTEPREKSIVEEISIEETIKYVI